jgi:hypothetical protein
MMVDDVAKLSTREVGKTCYWEDVMSGRNNCGDNIRCSSPVALCAIPPRVADEKRRFASARCQRSGNSGTGAGIPIRRGWADMRFVGRHSFHWFLSFGGRLRFRIGIFYAPRVEPPPTSLGNPYFEFQAPEICKRKVASQNHQRPFPVCDRNDSILQYILYFHTDGKRGRSILKI